MMCFFRLLLCSFFSFLFLFHTSTSQGQTLENPNGKILISQATVNAPLDKAWWGWTTDRGVKSFLAVDSKIDFRVNGNYNISLYTKDNFPNTDNRILSFIPFSMITFELEMPNKFSTLQGEKTQVVVEFNSLSDSQTDIKVTQIGWQKDGEWLSAYDYFQQTWLLALSDMQTFLPDLNTYEKKNDEEVKTVQADKNLLKQERDAFPAPPTSKTKTTATSSKSKYSFEPANDSDLDGVALPKPSTTDKQASKASIASEESTTPKNTDMQQFAYKLTLIDPELARNPDAWTPEQNALVGVHFNYLKKLTEEGTVIMAGRSPDPETGFGIVVFEAPSREVAQEIMYNDPAVKNGLMAAEFHDFRIALMRK